MDVSRPSIISVKAGESITFNCPFNESHNILDLVIWYKQIFGEMPQKVGEGLSYADVKISPEFETMEYNGGD